MPKFASVLALLFSSAAALAGEPGSRTFDSSPFSQAVTGCDRLAAHPEDPFKVTPGLPTESVDFLAAIAACRVALTQDPGNPRILYQTARALTYAGQVKEALPLIEKAVALHYPQALFVTGYLYLEGFAGAPKDPCRAAELLRESAEYGRMSAVLGYPAYALEGRFKGCPGEPSKAEVRKFLESARSLTSNYFHDLLIDALLRD